MDLETFRDNLRKILQDHNFSVRQMEIRCKLPRGRIHQFVYMPCDPKISEIVKIADVFEIKTIDDLIGRNKEKPDGHA